MSRRKSHGGHDDLGHDRPWVYFMIDCFFLVTQFFVITFHVRSDEVLLPQRLPPGGTKPSASATQDNKKKMSVHVTHNGEVSYECMQKPVNLAGLTEMLGSASQGGAEVSVKVSYEKDVPFADVMAVFNACSKVKIKECGLLPLRD